MKQPTTYHLSTWKRFRSDRLVWLAASLLVMMSLFAISANWWANEKPIYCQVDGKSYYPVWQGLEVHEVSKEFEQNANNRWASLPYEAVTWPPIPFGPNTQQEKASWNLLPFEHPQHTLGTDGTGRDILARLIYGSRSSLLVGLGVSLLASLIGIFLGSMAAFWGDDRLLLNRGMMIFGLVGLLIGGFEAFHVRRFVLADAIDKGIGYASLQLLVSLCVMILSGLIGLGMGRLLHQIRWFAKKIAIPIDSLVMRLIEILRSIPGLLLLLTISILFEESARSILLVILVIGGLGWTGIARFSREQVLRIRAQAYVEAATALGYRTPQIIFRHILPNALPHLMVIITLTIGYAILAEAGLSFLGFGIKEDTPTWGQMIGVARHNFRAWWISVPAGICLSLVSLSFNLMGERLRDALDPRRE